MPKEIVDLKKQLRELRFDMQFLQNIDCSENENKAYSELIKSGGSLPEGVLQRKTESGVYYDEFYTVYDAGLSNEEEQEYIQYQTFLHIKTIKNCIVFFTSLTAISLIATVVLLLR